MVKPKPTEPKNKKEVLKQPSHVERKENGETDEKNCHTKTELDKDTKYFS